MKEIVGAIINYNIVTNSLIEIVKAAKQGSHIKPLDRLHMKFMSGCDLGRNWDDMANGGTLFWINDDGKPQWTKEIE